MTPFLWKLGPKNIFLTGVSSFFLITTGLQHKLLKLIESPKIFPENQPKKVNYEWSLRQNLDKIRFNVGKNKEANISWVFSYFV